MSIPGAVVRRHAAIGQQEVSVKYMALIYTDERGTDAAVLEKYMAFAQGARAAGVNLGGNELAPVASATPVRVRGGETLVTDGPYAEAKEHLGGYFMLECATFDEAVEWAAKIPGAEHGTVEVRPVHVDED